MRVKFFSLAAAACLVLTPNNIATASFNLTDLAESSTSLSCMGWRPTGICFWLRCSFPSGCSINSSLRFKHYLPDAVVSVYQDPRNSPWQEFRIVSRNASLGQSGSTGSTFPLAGHIGNAGVVNRMVDVVGNPMSPILGDIMSSAGIGCNTQITPFQPYFLSALDYASWRYPYVEMLNIASIVPGLREVGFRDDGDNSFMATGRWGNLYPRTGSIIQQDHFKASATIAQRAISIATDTNPIHVVVPLEAESSRGVWPPGPAEEWSSDNGKWQMVYPKVESSCAIFGDRTKYTSELSLRDFRSDSGAYGWVYWRPWECCKREGQRLLYTVGF